MLAGAAGLVYALYQTNVWYFQGFEAGLIAFTAAVMGGIGNVREPFSADSSSASSRPSLTAVCPEASGPRRSCSPT